MSKTPKTPGGASTGVAHSLRNLIRRHRFWLDLLLVVGGSALAGFSTALLFGVQVGFTQPLATFLAGAGAVSAGVLAYINGERGRDQTKKHHEEEMARERERHADDTERARKAALWERFGAAAAQLADKSAAIRIAGVYAMAGVADERSQSERQQCIDVLCGYLRLPYDPAQGGSGRTKLVTKTVRSRDESEQEEHTEYLQNDREVRQTIIRVIADHLRADTAHDWTDATFDFRSAYLESPDFSGARFAGVAHFEHTRFSGNAIFREATFSGDANFEQAIFLGGADFLGTIFSGKANFELASFSGDAGFAGATFSGNAIFVEATFSGDVYFVKTTFFRDARFAKATLSKNAYFSESTFSGRAVYKEAVFSGDAGFGNATFSSHANFWGATFSGTPVFGSAVFSESVNFQEVTFSGSTYFGQATFRLVDFLKATFSGDATFEKANFSGDVRFDKVTFSGEASFEKVTFSGDATFENVTFSGMVKFLRAKFGTGSVSFTEPWKWDPPPQFDWDQDVSLKPSNVFPIDWPPTVPIR